jgi:acetate kinase
MRNPILVLNAGSSSLKFSIFETLDCDLAAGMHGQVKGIGGTATLEVADAKGEMLDKQEVPRAGYDGAIEAIHLWFSAHVGREAGFAAVGHRVVHGGVRYFEPVLVDDSVLLELEALIPLAPLHQPHNLAAIRAIRAVAPLVPQVACFDTAFHHMQPEVASRFALPQSITAKGVRRYGFHGLSYEYIVSALPAATGANAGPRIVVAHLGNGASMCAIRDGRSIASTMGFTAVDGLPMGTRTGTLDPGVILYLLQQEGMDAKSIEHLIYEQSGLLGVSGISSDMKTLLESPAQGARTAVEMFVYRIGRELGSLAAALGGLDALIFTGGIGENAPEIRERVCRDARWLGIELDAEANGAGGPRISTANSKVSAWMIPTDENLMVARHTRRLVDVGRASQTKPEGKR